MNFGLCEPVSYVPAFYSSMTDHMDFWGLVKNSLMFFISTLKEWYIYTQVDDSHVREHFPEGSRPELFNLQLKIKAELWFVNSDFAFILPDPCFTTLFTLQV